MAAADALLTALLSAAPAGLYASRGTGGRAETPVLLWPAGGPGREVCRVPGGVGQFRCLLARINHRYLDDQLYGGERRFVAHQGGRAYRVWVRTGNEQRTGYWVQATAEPQDAEPGAAPDPARM